MPVSKSMPNDCRIDASIGVQLTPALLEFLNNAVKCSSLSPDCLSNIKQILDNDNQIANVSISFTLLKSIHDHLVDLYSTRSESTQPSPPPLWRLIAGGGLSLPQPSKPSPNPELVARLAKLRAEQEQREYDRMTANIRSTQLGFNRSSQRDNQLDSLGSQFRIVNRQLATVANFIITVGAAFAFGYKACELSSENGTAPLAYKLSLGLLLGAIVFFADLYFVVKIDYLSGKRRTD